MVCLLECWTLHLKLNYYQNFFSVLCELSCSRMPSLCHAFNQCSLWLRRNGRSKSYASLRLQTAAKMSFSMLHFIYANEMERNILKEIHLHLISNKSNFNE